MILEFDLGAAQQFIGALTGDINSSVTWQTYPDKRDGPPHLRRVMHGTLEERQDELTQLNEQGAGIFVCVNETDGLGRKAENITALRSIFIDSDDGKIKGEKLPFSIRVETAHGEHGYYLLDKGEPMDKFTKTQKLLANALGTDPSVSDLPRVMRVPGFWHHKGDPFLVRLIAMNTKFRYSIKEIEAAYAEEKAQQPTPYGERALYGEIGRIVGAQEGGRHQAILAATSALGELVAGGELPADLVERKLRDAAKTASAHGEREISDEEISGAISYGLKKGKSNPRTGNKEKPDAGKEEKPKGPHPNLMAEWMAADHKYIRDETDNIYKYNGMFWEQQSLNMVKAVAKQYDKPEFTSDQRRSETVQGVLTSVEAQVGRAPWNRLADTEIPLQAGVLDILTNEMRDHRPEDYLDKVIDVEYFADAECPTWIKCLEDWFSGDPEGDKKIQAIQEFFGYCLMGHCKYKKALMLYGPSNTGKSVVVSLLRELVGAQNCCQIRVDLLGSARALAPIKGAMVNIMTELPENVMLADGGFKQLVGTEESIQIDQKYQKPEFYTPTCKHLFATNNLPDINDKTEATYNRLLVVPFQKQIPDDQQDVEILCRLRDELPGVLNWATAGARALHSNRGRFTVSAQSRDMLSDYRTEQNPVEMFICDTFSNGNSEYNYEFRRFCTRFNDWHGTRAWSPRAIGKALTAIGYGRKVNNGVRVIAGAIPRLLQ